MQDVHNGIRLEEYDEAVCGDHQDAGRKGAPEAACEYLRADLRKAMNQLREGAGATSGAASKLEPTYLDAVLMQGSLSSASWAASTRPWPPSKRPPPAGCSYVRAYEEAASVHADGRPSRRTPSD